jgi:hypothetical protein
LRDGSAPPQAGFSLCGHGAAINRFLRNSGNAALCAVARLLKSNDWTPFE